MVQQNDSDEDSNDSDDDSILQIVLVRMVMENIEDDQLIVMQV